MAKTLQFRRGTGAELDTETGANGEIFFDTTLSSLRVYDGATVGGTTLATVANVSTAYTNATSYADDAANTAYANAVAEASSTFNTLGTMSTQDAANVNIGGGLIDNTEIDRGSINRTEIGLSIPNDAAFVNASANNISSNNLSVAGIAYPTSDGANGQVMTTDGSGSLSFSTVDASPPTTEGAIGTYVFGGSFTEPDVSFGGTIAGSSIFPTAAPYVIQSASDTFQFRSGTNLTGTWRVMGEHDLFDDVFTGQGATLFVRIS